MVDKKGKVHAKDLTRGKARKMVTARNIAGGYVPGLKPRKR